jgi:hypothetical protein
MRHELPQASVVHYLPLGTAATTEPIPGVPSLRELPDSTAHPPLLPLSHWAAALRPSERSFQRHNYLLRTDVPLILLRMGNVSIAAANESLQLLMTLEASTTLAGTVIVLRDRMASLEPWSSLHPLFRYGARNGTMGSVRILIVSAHEPQVYHAWMKTADCLLLAEGNQAEALAAWHRIALAGGCLVAGPSVQQTGLPESVVRTRSAAEMIATVEGLLRSGAGAEKDRTREELAHRQAGSLDKLVDALRARPAVLQRMSAFASMASAEAWVEERAAEAGWNDEERQQRKA